MKRPQPTRTTKRRRTLTNRTALYFAYGSNLSLKQMKKRCPSARPVGAATLRGYRLSFGGHSRRWNGGVATVVKETGSVVQGTLYSLSVSELFTLDMYEGHPVAYRRTHFFVDDQRGRRCIATSYVKPLAEIAAPSTEYLDVIAEAYGDLGFDTQPLQNWKGVQNEL